MKPRNGSGWSLSMTRAAEKDLASLGTVDQLRVRKYLRALEGCADPRRQGKALGGAKSDFWRYRVGDVRILCRLEFDHVVVVVVAIAHRREVYR
jgi:mRNA interferase RelE/StbE